METTVVGPPTGIRPALVVLFLGAFAMGSAEMLVTGMLDLIAADLGVSVPAAGALVTAFASAWRSEARCWRC